MAGTEWGIDPLGEEDPPSRPTLDERRGRVDRLLHLRDDPLAGIDHAESRREQPHRPALHRLVTGVRLFIPIQVEEEHAGHHGGGVDRDQGTRSGVLTGPHEDRGAHAQRRRGTRTSHRAGSKRRPTRS